MAGEGLVKVMQNIAKDNRAKQAYMVFGTVVEVDPLHIAIDSKLVLPEDFLMLSTLMMETPLKEGDKVRMLRLNEGQLFYVLELDPEAEVTDDTEN